MARERGRAAEMPVRRSNAGGLSAVLAGCVVLLAVLQPCSTQDSDCRRNDCSSESGRDGVRPDGCLENNYKWESRNKATCTTLIQCKSSCKDSERQGLDTDGCLEEGFVWEAPDSSSPSCNLKCEHVGYFDRNSGLYPGDPDCVDCFKVSPTDQNVEESERCRKQNGVWKSCPDPSSDKQCVCTISPNYIVLRDWEDCETDVVCKEGNSCDPPSNNPPPSPTPAPSPTGNPSPNPSPTPAPTPAPARSADPVRAVFILEGVAPSGLSDRILGDAVHQSLVTTNARAYRGVRSDVSIVAIIAARKDGRSAPHVYLRRVNERTSVTAAVYAKLGQESSLAQELRTDSFQDEMSSQVSDATGQEVSVSVDSAGILMEPPPPPPPPDGGSTNAGLIGGAAGGGGVALLLLLVACFLCVRHKRNQDRFPHPQPSAPVVDEALAAASVQHAMQDHPPPEAPRVGGVGSAPSLRTGVLGNSPSFRPAQSNGVFQPSSNGTAATNGLLASTNGMASTNGNAHANGDADRGLCQICMEAPKTIKLQPCGHACLCRGCLDLVMGRDRKCIICRGDVTSYTEGNFIDTFTRAGRGTPPPSEPSSPIGMASLPPLNGNHHV